MEPTIFRFIFRYSKKEQILLLVLTAISFPFLYASLDLPKTIINQAIGGKADFPVEFLGHSFEQIPYLLLLCLAFLLLVCINGGFKYFVNVYRGQLGERMLRRLRFDLYARVLRFPLPHFRRVSQGEIIPMITAEVEPLGGFIGDAVALPAFQGGTLITILVFMFIQDPILGVAAIALYPVQMYLIPRLQAQVNRLGKQRVLNVRKLSEKLGESISGAQEIHANDGARWALAGFTERLGVIYDIRYEIYRRKFFIKFLNNFIAQLTPFFFYSIGGVLVIWGDLTFGALVAVLAAYKDLSAPWKELLTYYQRQADARIKYEQVTEQFDPPGILDEEMQRAELEADFKLADEMQASNLSLLDEEGQAIVEGISARLAPGEKVALAGPTGGGKDMVAMMLARLLMPSGGQINVGGRDLTALPEAATGRRMAYVGPTAFIFSNSMRANLLLGAMHAPMAPTQLDAEAGAERDERLKLAAEAGNSVDDPTSDWIDYAAIGIAGPEELDGRLLELLELVDLEEDVYQLGLRGVIDPSTWPETAASILDTRMKLRDRLADGDLAGLVEPFDEARYNTNATVAENLLFGTPVGSTFDPENLGQNAYVRSILDKAGLTERFLEIGREVAATMVELFSGLPPDHEFFSQFSFISAEDLPEFQILLARVERLGMDNLAAEDRDRFLDLPFKLAPARHRLGLVDDDLQTKLMAARQMFAEDLPEDLRSAIEPYSIAQYNAAGSLQDNILFGKIAYGQADASNRVGAAMAELIQAEGLRSTVVRTGLDYETGIGGSRLSAAQRQKLAIARSLLRRPDILVFNEATAALDSGSQARVLAAVTRECEGRTLIWALQRASLAEQFDRTLVIRGGRIVEEGAFDELGGKEGGALKALLAEE